MKCLMVTRGHISYLSSNSGSAMSSCLRFILTLSQGVTRRWDCQLLISKRVKTFLIFNRKLSSFVPKRSLLTPRAHLTYNFPTSNASFHNSPDDVDDVEMRNIIYSWPSLRAKLIFYYGHKFANSSLATPSATLKCFLFGILTRKINFSHKILIMVFAAYSLISIVPFQRDVFKCFHVKYRLVDGKYFAPGINVQTTSRRINISQTTFTRKIKIYMHVWGLKRREEPEITQSKYIKNMWNSHSH